MNSAEQPTGYTGPAPAQSSARGATRVRDIAAGVAAYGLMFFFWAVAAGLSANGLVGFGRDNMRLHGPWPYLLFFALDGAAGMCAVLLMRRAARSESATAPRLAVWGLVAASAAFNWTHAPDRPGAHEAFALMPIIAGVLFEFALHETKRTAGRTDRRMTAVRWLHPIERIRVQLVLAGDEGLAAEHATRQVRISRAAHHLYRLRRLQQTGASPRGQRAAERRAQRALARAGFADEQIAREVLRQFQVLTQAATLAALDYTTADDALTALSNLISATSSPPPPLRLEVEVAAGPASGGLAANQLDVDPATKLGAGGSRQDDIDTVGENGEGDADQEVDEELAETGTVSSPLTGTADPRRTAAGGGQGLTAGNLAMYPAITPPIAHNHPAATSSPIGNGSGGRSGSGGARVIKMPGTANWRDLLHHDPFQAAAAFISERQAAGRPRHGAGAEFARLAIAAGSDRSDRQLRNYITQAYAGTKI